MSAIYLISLTAGICAALTFISMPIDLWRAFLIRRGLPDIDWLARVSWMTRVLAELTSVVFVLLLFFLPRY